MSFKFGKRSKKKLSLANTQLLQICYEVIKHTDFGVYESHRTTKRQQQLFKDGKSQLDGIKRKSNHQSYPSKAIDIFPYRKGHNSFDGTIESELMFHKLYVEFQKASEKLDISIKWGGSWSSFKDLPHIELRG